MDRMNKDLCSYIISYIELEKGSASFILTSRYFFSCREYILYKYYNKKLDRVYAKRLKQNMTPILIYSNIISDFWLKHAAIYNMISYLKHVQHLNYIHTDQPYLYRNLLLPSCEYNSIDVFMFVVDTYPDIDLSYSRNHLINISCVNGYTDIAMRLIQHPKVIPKDGILVKTIEKDYELVFNIVKAYPNFGFPKLFKYCCIQDNEILAEMMLIRSNVKMENDYLTVACEYNSIHILRLLIRCNVVDLSKNESECVRVAAKFGSLSICRELLKYENVDPGAMKNAAIRIAVKKGNTGILKCLLESPKTDPNVNMCSTLLNACTIGQLNCVRLLLAHEKTIPHISNNKPLSIACSNNHIEIVRELLEIKSVINNISRDFLQRRISHYSSKIIELLLLIPRVRKIISKKTIKAILWEKDNYKLLPLLRKCDNFCNILI